MRKIKDVLRLKLQAGLSHERIATCLNISKGVVARTDVLLLDDWGMAAMDAQTRADLLEIIDDRAATKATIITSQLPIEHWHAWVGDATIADAMLDRLMQRHHRFTLTGESLRQRPKTAKHEKNPDPS